MYVIKEPKNYDFEKVGIKGKIFSMKDLTDKTHFVLIETKTGHETKIIEHQCDFIYYVLEGKGFFEIGGVREAYQKGNLVVIPAGHSFIYKGKLKMLLSTTPPYTSEQEETLE